MANGFSVFHQDTALFTPWQVQLAENMDNAQWRVDLQRLGVMDIRRITRQQIRR